MGKVTNLLKSMVLPFVIVLAFSLVFSDKLLNAVSTNVITYIVVLMLGVATALSIGFKRSRYFFILLLVCINYYLQVQHPASIAINSLMLILLPLNILIFALVGDRGIISFWGRIQMAFIAVQAAAVYWSVNTKSLMELVHLQTSYAAASSMLSYPTLQFLIAGSCIALLAIFSLIQFAGNYGGFMGLITSAWLGNYYSGDPQAVALFTMAGGIIIIAETIKDIYQFAFLDELTGLYSRRSLNQDQIKLGGTYAVAMLDIDHFKKFNDTYGHDVGDQVLKYVAALIKGTPGGGKPYRYGGEEFTLIFTGKTRHEVVPFLEELQDIMKARPFTLRSQDRPKKKPRKSSSGGSQRRVDITMSIGVADNEKRNLKP
ncbi:MAG: GGDEF domain-containing protein, partial [Candidatus Saccharibacteria bacterium]